MAFTKNFDEGVKLYEQGAYNDALRIFEEALQDSAASSDDVKQALKYVGLIYNNLKDYDAATQFYEKLLSAAASNGKTFILNRLGMIYQAKKDLPRAIEYHVQCLDSCKHESNKKWISITLRNLGRLYTATGDHVKALKCHEESLRLKREIGDREGEATTLVYWAGDYEDAGDFQKAVELLELAADIYGELGLKEKVSEMESEITRLEEIEEDYVEEEDYLSIGLKGSRRLAGHDFFDKYM